MQKSILTELFFFCANKSGIGVVIRNNRGLVIASCSQVLHQEFNNNKIEALAVAKAMSFVAELGISKAVLEGDLMVIIKALKDEHNPLSAIGLLIADAKFNSRCFNHLLFSHTKRECNSIAHVLARFAVNILDFLVWMEDVPPQFHFVLQADLAT